MEISAKIISQADTAKLLDFELENRQWFEKHIPPRLDSFYSLSGVQSQIETFLEQYENETLIPMLLWTPDGELCGRLNLTIDESEPTVGILGYRVGERFTRQGVASQAISLIQQYIVQFTEITTLKAIALTSNIGSSKALENNGFNKESNIKNFVLLNGRHEDANEYIWTH
ncbi:GNAT family N-acetyltransferase [Vibrio sp. HN007]|uniref:GNAT family N-acetyltransferase n=1 Tax=Vibrio iocasae TaxID=3098914 RepID=UPI0035D524E5